MRKILIVIDMQNDFIDGSLGTKEAVDIVENVKKKILTYDKRDVFATMDTHKENYLDTQEGKNLPVEHCIEDANGWELHPDISKLIDPENIFNDEVLESIKKFGESIVNGDVKIIINKSKEDNQLYE